MFSLFHYYFLNNYFLNKFLYLQGSDKFDSIQRYKKNKDHHDSPRRFRKSPQSGKKTINENVSDDESETENSKANENPKSSSLERTAANSSSNFFSSNSRKKEEAISGTKEKHSSKKGREESKAVIKRSEGGKLKSWWCLHCNGKFFLTDRKQLVYSDWMGWISNPIETPSGLESGVGIHI